MIIIEGYIYIILRGCSLKFRDVETLGFAQSSLRDFILNNGIYKIPEWWAFTMETCSILSWLVVFFIALALLIGYSRQMSGFFFLYQHVVGGELDNPYKPALMLTLVWCGLYVISGTVTIGGVYVFKYGYLYGGLIGICGLLLLGALFYAGVVLRRKKPQVQGYRPPPPQAQHYHQPQQFSQVPQYTPVQQAVPAPEQQHMIEGPNAYPSGQYSQSGQEPQADAQFEEALTILGLERNFTAVQLKKKYKAMLKNVHPDKGGSEGLYLKVKTCYEYLLHFCS